MLPFGSIFFAQLLWRQNMVNRIYLVILILVFSAGCSINPVTGQQDFVLMSEQEELALGRQT